MFHSVRQMSTLSRRLEAGTQESQHICQLLEQKRTMPWSHSGCRDMCSSSPERWHLKMLTWTLSQSLPPVTVIVCFSPLACALHGATQL